MNREEIDKLWNKAIREAMDEGCLYTRYHFAELVVAAEREACAKVCEDNADDFSEGVWDPACISCAAAIRARSPQ